VKDVAQSDNYNDESKEKKRKTMKAIAIYRPILG
jgi:hypothetical protein